MLSLKASLKGGDVFLLSKCTIEVCSQKGREKLSLSTRSQTVGGQQHLPSKVLWGLRKKAIRRVLAHHKAASDNSVFL